MIDIEKLFSETQFGLGGAQLGNLYMKISDQEAEVIVDAAWNAGVRVFDTAPHYGLGLSEERLGEALSKYPRNEYFLSTKVGRIIEDHPESSPTKDDQGFDVFTTKKRKWDFTRDGIFRSVEDSLKRMNIDYLDLGLLHDPDEHFAQASTEGARALVELRDQGVVRSLGAGMNNCEPLIELIHVADLDFVMCAGKFTLLNQEAAEELIPLAQKNNVKYLAAGVYNSGALSTPAPQGESYFNYAKIQNSELEKVREIYKVCRNHGIDLATAAVGFAKNNSSISAVILGAQSNNQVAENIQRFETDVNSEIWEELMNLGLINAY